MDKLFKQTLPADPSEVEYLYWKKMLTLYITHATVEANQKLSVLMVLCGAKAFPYIED
jgi:hypothetical protein